MGILLSIRKVMLTFLIDKIHCTQIYFINLAQNKLTESQRRKLKLLQIIRLSDLFSIRKVILTFLIDKTHCTQFYQRKIGAEQINGKPKRKVKIIANFKAFRFVLYQESRSDFSIKRIGLPNVCSSVVLCHFVLISKLIGQIVQQFFQYNSTTCHNQKCLQYILFFVPNIHSTLLSMSYHILRRTELFLYLAEFQEFLWQC